MNVKSLLSIFGSFALAAFPLCAQQFPGRGDDLTTSLGSFKVKVTNAAFANLLNGCPGYDATNQILQSPTLYDPATLVGRSDVITDGDANDTAGVAVGTAGTNVPESILFPPTDFPCGTILGCTSGSGTREVHTEVRSLKMTSGPVAVRAGLWYDSSLVQTNPPSQISPGEVESQSGPNGNAANDFPASSFFDVFVQVDIPACGGLQQGLTLFNDNPLLVKNYSLTAFPPKVVYLHDSSSVVAIKFLNDGPGWTAGTVAGSFVLAGHGIGFTNSDSDVKAFNDFMNCVGGSSSGTAAGTTPNLNVCVISTSPSPAPAATTSKPATKPKH